ncbi:MAG TPA: addiction module protein [Thermoanaerobaculia bacterium]|nr:addiction module protein [Thermoanaerobaculia bacterium]
MSTTTDELLETALKLPSRDRARLAGELIASLDGPPDEGAEEAWAAEIERRAAEVDSGKVKLLDWETVRDRAKRESRKR